jgi:hypothetical protein
MAFIKGLELCESFFEEALKPLLAAKFPDLAYSAGRLDRGSDVLGFDTPQSMDHDWGPRVQLFLREEDWASIQGTLDEFLGNELPFEFRGFSTHFALHDDGTRFPEKKQLRPIRHGIAIATLSQFFMAYLGVDPQAGIGDGDWLLFPQQHLRTIRSGRVFHDGLGSLHTIKESLAWYPADIWIHLLACQWRRIDQIAPQMGRCGDVGDELGSRMIATRLVHEIMGLCFLMERQYAPYSKWFGTAFSQLACAEALTPLFEKIMKAENWKQRELGLSNAYGLAIRQLNGLKLTPAVDTSLAPFHHRPYLVPNAAAIIEALHGAIQSKAVQSLPQYIGSVDQFVDATDVLDYVQRCQALKAMYPLVQ